MRLINNNIVGLINLLFEFVNLFYRKMIEKDVRLLLVRDQNHLKYNYHEDSWL